MLIVSSCMVIYTLAGNLFQPIAYTLPNGLTATNGSVNITGVCQPVGCLMMPVTGSTTNGCDCTGDTPASGVLIDGVIPSIDTTQRGTWASQLFVVNRNGRASFTIGFQFSSFISLRHVSISYLNCGIWNTGLSSINVRPSIPMAFLHLWLLQLRRLVHCLWMIILKVVRLSRQSPSQFNQLNLLPITFLSFSF